MRQARYGPWHRGRRGGLPDLALVRSVVRRAARYLPPAILIAAFLAVWQAFTQIRQVPDYLLPSPSLIWQSAVDQRDVLMANAIPTAQEAVLGLCMALILGLLLALAIHLSRTVEIALYPILIGSQSVPLIALAPVLVVLLGYDLMPKLVMVCLVCFFPIVVNTVDGFKAVDPDLERLLRALGAGRLRRMRDLECPTALPYVFSGMRVAATFSVVGAVVGEWAGSSAGLGHLIFVQSSQFDTALIFAAMGVLTLMGIALFLVIVAAERVLVPWRATRMQPREDTDRQSI